MDTWKVEGPRSQMGKERLLEAVILGSCCFLRRRRLRREDEVIRGSSKVDTRLLLGRGSEVAQDRRKYPA